MEHLLISKVILRYLCLLEEEAAEGFSPIRAEEVRRGLLRCVFLCGGGESLLKVTSHTANKICSSLPLSFPGLSAWSKR